VPTWINDETLTSSSGRVNVCLTGIYQGWNGSTWDPNSGDWYGGVIHINSIIANNGNREVGLRIYNRPGNGVGIDPNAQRGFAFLRGATSNTFTGDTEVLDGNILVLNKSNGATAIQGNVYVSKGGAISIWQSNQIADTSTVTLDGREGMAGFAFDIMSYKMTEKFHKLVVKGEGRLLFHRHPNTRILFLDDLLIEEGGTLHIGDWVDGVTRLLVRKDSENLGASLKRISFEGYEPNKINLVNYNSDYWEVSALPEPATYGAVVLCGLTVWWRRQRSHG